MRTGSGSYFAALAVLVLSSIACASRPSPQALPPQTIAPTPPETGEEPISNIEEALGEQVEPPATGLEPSPPPATLEPPDFVMIEELATTAGNPTGAEPVTPEDPLTVVIDPGINQETQPRSLFEASQAEKDRRRDVGESEIVLTNKNLKQYSKGQLTFLEGEDEAAGDEADDSEAVESAEAEQAAQDEEYWRKRVLEIRTTWRESLDRMDELESEIARLRTDFYAEDDPFYRDAQIKPAWDQALIDFEAARRDAEASQVELEEAMTEGRRAGALPGWLREGIELEPAAEELEERQLPEDSRVHEPSEPVVLEDDDGGNGTG